jgi:phosphomevalonate kinase
MRVINIKVNVFFRRRATDVKFFQEKYGPRLITVRIEASEEVRKQRGWVFTPGKRVNKIMPFSHKF